MNYLSKIAADEFFLYMGGHNWDILGDLGGNTDVASDTMLGQVMRLVFL
jgi:hypothetical protein